MPSMFSRRRGNSVLPPVDRSTSAAANAAASQAFITKSQSMTSLSSAAAAAALRSLATTPEPVGNIQTKRMVRRGSQSSINSGTFSTRGGAGAPARSAAGRTNSMTERTFRSPSPGGRNGAASPAYDPNAPPVPAIPRYVPNGHLRSSSVEAPSRVVSPTEDSGRAMSMDRRSMQTKAAVKKPPRLSNVAEEMEAADRRNSINFSRPISPPASPITAAPPKKYTHGTGGWYSGASGAAADKGANQQTNTKKKVTSNATTQAQQADPETVMVFDPNTRTFVAQLKSTPAGAAPPSPPNAKPAAPRWDPSTRTVIPAAAAPAAGGPGPLIGTASAPKPAQTLAVDPKLNPPPRNPQRVSPSAGEVPKTTQRAMSLQAGGGSAQQYVAQRKGSLDIPGGAGRGRNNSLSPQRSAHFSPSPVIEAQIHEPPGRAISPGKSALKHSPASSVRTTSPLPPSALSKVAASDMSDTNSMYSQDGMGTKGKKNSRVSFDEKALEIAPATAASPARALARDEDDTDDEIMRPRPALPSFGSVRRNRPASPEIAEKVTEMPPERHEVSSDPAVGGILANAEAEKQSESSDATVVAEEPFEPSITSTPAKLPSATHNSQNFTSQTEESKPEQNIHVPGIALMPPTPVLDDEQKQLSLQEEHDEGEADKRLSKDSMAGIAVPGGWSDSASKTASTISSDQPVATTELGAIDEDSDPEFADAAEDLDDNGGYASLNAIANSPVATTTDKKVAKSPPESPTAARASDEKTRTTGDWTEATAYWSQLSKAQREQIEREHLSSDDEARPAEEKKPRKKKSAMKPGTETAQPVEPLKPALKKTMRAQPAAAPTDTAGTPEEAPVRLRRSMRDGPMSSATMRRGNSERQRPQSAPVPPRAEPVRPANNRLSHAAPVSSDTKSDVYTAKLQSKYNNDSDSESSFKKKRRQGGSTLDNQGRYNMKRSMRAGSLDQPREARPVSPDRAPKGSGRTFSLRSLSPSGPLFNRRRPEKIRQSLRSGAGASISESNLRTSLRGPPAAQKPKAAPAPTRSKFRSRFADSDDEDEDDRPSRSFFSSRFADSDDSDPGSPTVMAADLRPVRGIPRKRGQEDGDSTDLEDEDEGADKQRYGRGSKIPLVPDPADVEKAMEAARKKLGIPEVSTANIASAQQGSALNRGSLRKPAEETPEPKSRAEDIHFGLDRKKPKGGLMGSILRRNRNSTQSVPTMGSMAVEPAPPLPTTRLADIPKPSTPTTANHTNTTAAATTAAPANATTASTSNPVGRLLRRDRAKRTLSNVSIATAPPEVGSPPPVPDIKDSEHWPLPATLKGTANGKLGDDDRPNTSDGVSDRQGVTLGRSTTHVGTSRKSVRIAGVDGEIEDPNAVYSSRTGRKKKFGKLRRAFGLHD